MLIIQVTGVITIDTKKILFSPSVCGFLQIYGDFGAQTCSGVNDCLYINCIPFRSQNLKIHMNKTPPQIKFHI